MTYKSMRLLIISWNQKLRNGDTTWEDYQSFASQSKDKIGVFYTDDTINTDQYQDLMEMIFKEKPTN